MTSHFITEKNSTFKIIIAAILMFPTLGFPMWGAYEYFFVPHYWKNRWRLNRLLKKGKVKAQRITEFDVFADSIVRIKLEIEGIEYGTSIWNGNRLVLDKDIFGREDYIGLFAGSAITKYLNRRSVKMISDLIK